jgi:replicative DNA helicase
MNTIDQSPVKGKNTRRKSVKKTVIDGIAGEYKFIPDEASSSPLPHNLVAESGVIGSVLLDNARMDDISHILDSGDLFFDSDNKSIWSIIKRLIERGGKATPSLVASHLSSGDGLDIRLEERLTKDTRRASTQGSDNLIPYAKTIRRHYEKRTAYAILMEQANKALSKENEDDILADTARLLNEADCKGDFEFKSYATFFDAAVDNANNAHMRGDGLLGLPTGIPVLDEMTGGIPSGGVTIIAGGTSHGKTVLGMQIAFHNARLGTPVAVFSMEMAGDILAARDIANGIGINIGDMLRGRIDERDMGAMLDLRKEAERLPLIIDDTANLKPSQLKSRAKRLIRDRGVKLLIIDYLQLMDSDEWGKDEYQRLGKISPALKHMAKDLKIPVIALAQLNRQFDTQKRPPEKHDLRGSGQLEQDAEQIWMVYRPELQPGTTEEEEQLARSKKGRANIYMRKNRALPLSEIEVGFNGVKFFQD